MQAVLKKLSTCKNNVISVQYNPPHGVLTHSTLLATSCPSSHHELVSLENQNSHKGLSKYLFRKQPFDTKSSLYGGWFIYKNSPSRSEV